MATFRKRGKTWLCQIRRVGYDSISRTFNTKAEAERWAASIESKMGSGEYVDQRESMSVTLGDCLKRYLSEITPAKKSAHVETARINKFLRHEMANKPIGLVKSFDVAKWRDEALASGKTPGTIKVDIALISHLYTIAAKEWGLPVISPVRNIRLPKVSNSRDRVLLPSEEKQILEIAIPEMKAIIIVAIETAMRRSEIINLKWDYIKGKVATLPDTKNGSSRRVPLSKLALDTLHALPRNIDGRIFTLSAEQCTREFTKYCENLSLVNLHFHDLRHTATTNLFNKGLSVMEVQSITGHKDLKMLLRYTHINADDLATKLG